MSKIIINNADIVLDTSDIEDIQAHEYIGSDRKDNQENKMFLIRIKTKKPEINIALETLSQTQKLYKNLNKTLDVVDINTQRDK